MPKYELNPFSSCMEDLGFDISKTLQLKFIILPKFGDVCFFTIYWIGFHEFNGMIKAWIQWKSTIDGSVIIVTIIMYQHE